MTEKKMEVKFREYSGVGGDCHVLLIAETEDGRSESIMYNRIWFAEFNRRVAEKILLRRLGRNYV